MATLHLIPLPHVKCANESRHRRGYGPNVLNDPTLSGESLKEKIMLVLQRYVVCDTVDRHPVRSRIRLLHQYTRTPSVHDHRPGNASGRQERRFDLSAVDQDLLALELQVEGAASYFCEVLQLNARR